MSRRVLIADATATNRIALKAALSAARYQVRAVPTAALALASLASDGADLVIADAALPDLSGIALCARIRDEYGAAAPPMILLSDEEGAEFRTAALNAGAATLMIRPLDRPWLLTNMRSLLRANESRSELRRRNATASRLGFSEAPAGFDAPGSIAVVATSRTTAAAFARGLRDDMPHDIVPMTPAEALIAADGVTAPDIFVMCHEEGDIDDVLWLLAELRANGNTRRAAFVVEYDQKGREKGARALDLGASDLVPVRATPAERIQRILRQLRLKREADTLRATVDAGLALAAHDPLTGLYNRRYAMHHMTTLAARPHAAGRGYGALLADVDHFKAVNDTYGHAAGDAVLVQVAQRLRENIRDVDLVARIGGEEFLIALPDTAPDEAMIAAERLRAAIASAPVTTPAGTGLSISVSIGVCCTTSLPEDALSTADMALYRAKADGRNRTRLGTNRPPRFGNPAQADFMGIPPAERAN